MTAVSSVITSGMQQYNNFVEERLEKRTQSIKRPCGRTSCMCLCNNGRLRNLPWQSSATATRCFRSFTWHARQGMGTCPNFSGTKTSQHYHHWANSVIYGQVKTQTCWSVLNAPLLDLGMLLGRSPGRWNKQHWLWTDGWPCQRWYRHRKAFWFYQWNWAWTCTQEEEQLINKDTAAYIAADRSSEADVKFLDGAFVVQPLSPRTSTTFQDYSNSLFLTYIFGHLQSVRRLNNFEDVYLAESLKAGTRSKRGQGQRRKVFTFGTITFHLQKLPDERWEQEWPVLFSFQRNWKNSSFS